MESWRQKLPKKTVRTNSLPQRSAVKAREGDVGQSLGVSVPQFLCLQNENITAPALY